MDAIDALFARRSIPRLVDPGPDDDEVGLLLSAAVAAPDHGEARPWRFVVFRGEERERFGLVLERAARARAAEDGSDLDDERAAKERRRFLRAPVVVAVVCRMQARRVLQAEQRDAVAAATQNLLLAATARGWGSVWRTGEAALSSVVRDALGLANDDAIVAFVYLGTIPPDGDKPPRPLDPSPFIEPPPG
jgi:nitroreductase